MAKILINSPIYSFYTTEWIKAIHEVPAGEDLDVYLNTPGGEVLYAWGVFQAMAEHNGKVNLKISGHAMSMGILFPPFADYTEALDITTFMLHRANMYISNPEDKAELDKYNKDLFSKIDAKIDSVKLKEISGFTLKEIFNSTEQKNVFLTAKEAKAIGLIDKVVKLERKSQATAFFGEEVIDPSFSESEEEKINGPHGESHNNNKNKITMTLAKLLLEYPLIHAEAVALGVSQGETKERDRIGAWIVFMDIDPEAVKKGIEGGKAISNTEMAMFNRAGLKAELKAGLTGDSKSVVTDPPTELTAEQKAEAEFDAAVNAKLGLNKKEEV